MAKRWFVGFIALLVVLGMAGGAMAATALFIGDAKHAGAASDQVAVQELGKLGFTVTFANHSDAAAQNPDKFDLVVISSTSTSGSIAGAAAYFSTATPVVNWEAFLMDDFSITATPANETATAITLVGPVLKGFKVELVTKELPFHVCSADAKGAQVLATAGANAALTVVDKGAALVNGNPSPNRRVMFAGGDEFFTNATPALFQLFAGAVNWAVGK